MKRFLFLTCIVSILALILPMPGRASLPVMAAEPSPHFADSVSGQLLPLLHAQGAILVDADTGKIIFSVNEQERLYPASTTKILTALLAIEKGDLDEKVTVGDEIFLSPPGSSRAGLVKGQAIPLRELIYALMLPSGNDAALTIAVHIARKANSNEQLSTQQALEVFSNMMNQRAQELGAWHSHFINPHGYHDANHYTTPADMAVIARQAFLSPFFRQVVRSASFSPKWTDSSWEEDDMEAWVNTNQLLQKDSPYFMQEANGVKTGHTAQAGYCLVSSATHGDAHLLAVVLNSTPTGVYIDSIYLLKYGFVHYPAHIPLPTHGDKDYPYADKASSIYRMVLLTAGVYAATRSLVGWMESIKKRGQIDKNQSPYL